MRSGLDYQRKLEELLLEYNSQGKYVAVFIDEAENLDTYMLDLVRTLLNFEKSDTGKMIQFVLAGAIELHDRLRRKRNRAIDSRILYSNFLEKFSLEESVEMIAFRCDRLDVPNPFSRSGLEAIHKLSGGVPRRLLAVASAGYDMRMLAPADKLDGEFVEMAYRSAREKPDHALVAANG